MRREIDLTPALPSAFATLNEVKAYLGVSGSGDDTTLTLMLDTAMQLIEDYCSAIFTQRTVVETVRPDMPFSTLVLRYAPAIALTSIVIDEVAETNADYVLSKAFATLKRVDGATFPTGIEVVVTYTAGFAAIPSPVKQACLDLVANAYREKDRNQNVSRMSVPDVADVSYATGNAHMAVGPTGAMVPFPVASNLARYVQRYAT